MIDDFEGAPLQRRRRGEDIEGCRMVGSAADVAHESREISEQRAEAMRRRAILEHRTHRARSARTGHQRAQGSLHAQGTTLSKPTNPNDLWCADYKGEFMLADKRCCDALKTTKESYAFTVFERGF